MRLLLVANSPFTGEGPYIPELVEALEGTGCDVTGFNDEALMLYQSGVERCASRLWPTVRKIPYLRRWFRRNRVKAILGSIGDGPSFDAVNVHYVKPEYRTLLPALRFLGARLVVTVWGSDFYRMDVESRTQQRAIYEAADSIMFGNPQTRDDFVRHYGAFEGKTRICSFGLKGLDVLADLMAHETRSDAKRHMGLPANKIVVCCGANAYPSQNHVRILEGMSGASARLRERIHLVLPMTYPLVSASYKAKIAQSLKATGASFTVMDRFMLKTDVARLRLASDIMVLMQETDQLSGSLQEHVYAGSIVIAGEWLPYKVFENEGIYLQRAGLADVGTRIAEVIEDLDGFRARASGNRDAVYRFSNWKSRVNRWKDIYEE